MVKLQLIVGLCAFVMGVQALNQAVTYELLYFYSVYKMEYRALAEGSRTIATGCVHNKNQSPAGKQFEIDAEAAGVLGICTFDEFVKEIGSKQTLNKLPWSTGGRSLNPDPDDAAKRIIALGLGETRKLLYWPSKLLPNRGFPTGTKGAILQVPMPVLFQGVLDAAQNARRAASTASSDVSNFVNSCVTDGKTYLRIGTQFRMSDRAGYLTPENLSKLPEGAPFSTFYQTKPQVINNVDGVTPILDTLPEEDFPLASYKVIDWDKVWLDSAASTTLEQRAALEGALEAAAASTTATHHQDVIDMQTFSTDLLSGSDLACRSPPTPALTKRDITLMGKRTLMHLVRKHKL